MDIKIENDIAYLVLKTSLVAANTKELAEKARQSLESAEYKHVVIDLSASESVDSMGISFLVGMYKTVKIKGKLLYLRGVSESMMRLFRIMRLDELFIVEK